MRISPKIQTAAFDVAEWEEDSEFGIFPQGARAKDAVFAPDSPPEPVIKPGRRYLFKRSRERYPDQFWGEVVAYRIGCLLGVTVPPAFAAWNSKTQICASLIEWFYVDGMEAFISGGDLISYVRPDFDRKSGEQHNMKDNIVLMRMFYQTKSFYVNWRQWWVDALLFDALIGNTDRHQDNWGLLFGSNGIRLSPLFDNGTALGHEMFCARVKQWHDQELDRYIGKGFHHLRRSLDDTVPIRGHLDLLQWALAEWPETYQTAGQRLNFSATDLSDAVSDLMALDVPVRFSPERCAFILRLLKRRHERLKSIFA